jgi:hypothetical protein
MTMPLSDKSDFIPTYPGGLPFHIGDHDGNKLEIHLQRFSLDLVRTVESQYWRPASTNKVRLDRAGSLRAQS